MRWWNVVKHAIAVSSVLLTQCAQSMQASGVLILASVSKPLTASKTLSKKSFSCFFKFLILRCRPYSPFSSQYFSRSCQSFLVFSWRFKFSCLKFVTYCWSIAAVELTSSKWFLYFCIIFWNYDWIKTFMLSMSSLITEDFNSFNFLSITVIKSSLLTSLLSSWTAAAEQLFEIIYIYIYITSIIQHYFENINNYFLHDGIAIN